MRCGAEVSKVPDGRAEYLECISLTSNDEYVSGNPRRAEDGVAALDKACTKASRQMRVIEASMYSARSRTDRDCD